MGQRLFLGSEYAVADPQSGLDWTTDGGALALESSGASAFLTAPASPGTVTVTVAGRGAHAGMSARTSITVVAAAPAPIAALPSAATLNVYQSMLLEAVDASGAPIPNAVWSVQEANGGWVSAAGMYEAPGQAGTYHVTAGLPGAPSTTATATITVVSGGGGGGDGDPVPTDRGVTVSPDRAQIPAGTYQAFAAAVAGLDDQSVTWRLETATPDASIGNDGVFTANRPGTYRVVAASTVDPSLNGSSVVTVVSSVTPIAGAPANLSLRGYSVTALNDGRILIAGGYDGNNVPSGAGQVYDPAAGTFTSVSNAMVGMAYHTANLLEDGRVLLSGGFAAARNPSGGVSGPDYQWRQAAVYDPVSNSFQALPVPTNTTYPDPAFGQMRGSHPYGTAVKLGDGKVLVVGDNYPMGDYNGHQITAYQRLRRSDVFDPATNTFDVSNWNAASTGDPWTATPNCFETLPGQTAVALDDGRALITGGNIPPVADSVDPCTGAVKTPYGETAGAYPYSACIKSDAKIFASGAVTSIAPMTTPRTFHTMTKLADGRVLITGGYISYTFDATPPVRDPVSGIFDPHTKLTSTATAEIFDPATGVFTPVGSMGEARASHAAILLPTGKVMIVGGRQEHGDGTTSWPRTIEVFDPETGSFSVMDQLAYGVEEPHVALTRGGYIYIDGSKVLAESQPVSLLLKTNQAMNQIEFDRVTALIYIQPIIRTINNTNEFYIAGTVGGVNYPVMPYFNSKIYGIPDFSLFTSEWLPMFVYKTRQHNPITLVDKKYAWASSSNEYMPFGVNLFKDVDGQLINTIRGGNLYLIARINYFGVPIKYSAQKGDMKILGENPSREAVIEILASENKVMPDGTIIPANIINSRINAITCQESRQRQFAVYDNFLNSYNRFKEPIQSFDGGIGLMQITRKRTVLPDDQRLDLLWNWVMNAREGINVFRTAISTSYNYPTRVLNSEQYQTIVENTNRYRALKNMNILSRIRVRKFTIDELIQDATRLYNGPGERRDQFGLIMHEYRLRTHIEPGIGMILDVVDVGADPENPGQQAGWAFWEVVPVSERGTSGEPNYVNLVLARVGSQCTDN